MVEEIFFPVTKTIATCLAKPFDSNDTEVPTCMYVQHGTYMYSMLLFIV